MPFSVQIVAGHYKVLFKKYLVEIAFALINLCSWGSVWLDEGVRDKKKTTCRWPQRGREQCSVISLSGLRNVQIKKRALFHLR